MTRDIEVGPTKDLVQHSKRFGEMKLKCTVYDLLTRQINFTSMAELPPFEAISNPYDEADSIGTLYVWVITKILQLIQ